MEHIGLDETERKIVDCLREDGRMSHADIGRRLDLAEATVRRRILRLQEEGTLKVVPVLNPDNLGLSTSLFVGVRISPGEWERVTEAITKLPEVRYVAVTTGMFSLLVEAYVAHSEHMAEFILDAIGKIPGVLSTETMTVMRVAKFVYEWEVPDVSQ